MRVWIQFIINPLIILLEKIQITYANFVQSGKNNALIELLKG